MERDRIGKLTKNVKDLPTDEIGKGLKGLMVGAVYSLRQAADLGFEYRDAQRLGPDYAVELDDVCNYLLSPTEKLLPDKWLAGFFFNSALIRIAAGSHRVLRMLLGGDDGGFDNLAMRVMCEKGVDLDTICLLKSVYQDMNSFKHHRDKLLGKRRIKTLDDGIDAAEKLLKLIRKVGEKT